MYLKDTEESLVRIGPGTPMGDLLRRFWIPALLERELHARSGPVKHVRLLGEDLDADADGHHFTASLDGTTYPIITHNGVVWTYMGRKEFMPQPPDVDWTADATVRRSASKHDEPRSWAQAVEDAIEASNNVAKFVPPFYTSASGSLTFAWVPIDDTHTCAWTFDAHPAREWQGDDVIGEGPAHFRRLMVHLARDNARGHAPN